MPTKRAGASPAPPSITKSLSSGPKTLPPNASVFDIAHYVWQQYLATTSERTMLLDVFMVFLVLVGAIQFAYCVLAGNFPFNAFLSGFSAAVGQFVLTASLRMQTSNGVPKEGTKVAKSKDESGQVGSVSHERAFADYIFGSLILHFFCINFIN
ncbi:oligosaccharyltransferase complex subunit epsilon [Aspergillus nanangensis]|uniref:Dolichyl-diphosphooligosaccharide--protein glycosyltransferase subunit OST2 n=1 Tax=Aspergillus nanangensis TaxID=2582783 RepID=A0AAD4CAZ7_ASPNN|nr:oligosaccharyltransferase complex subunit epsilon [Aspergillus nanangensis]